LDASYARILHARDATIGMLAGIAQRKRVRGRSMELVAWFYWNFIVVGGMCLVPNKWLLPAGGTLCAFAILVSLIVYFQQKATTIR
jgi:hypothetical protein